MCYRLYTLNLSRPCSSKFALRFSISVKLFCWRGSCLRNVFVTADFEVRGAVSGFSTIRAANTPASVSFRSSGVGPCSYRCNCFHAATLAARSLFDAGNCKNCILFNLQKLSTIRARCTSFSRWLRVRYTRKWWRTDAMRLSRNISVDENSR